ncbi:MAG: anthranilate synthase component I family protein [Bacteroidia bacterium]|nr:anthranilate synthase component I family protein [Bacteroidia bacterium]
MRKSKTYPITENFKEKLLLWADTYPVCAFLDSNNFKKINSSTAGYHTFDCIVAVDTVSEITIQNKDSFSSLKNYHEATKDWLFGFLTYDLKNEVEELHSENPDGIGFPAIHFFQPKFIIIITDDRVELLYHPLFSTDREADDLYKNISNFIPDIKKFQQTAWIKCRFTKEEYLETVYKIKQHIQHGDVYEINLCQEFFSENAFINPVSVYKKLSEVSPTPFACFYKFRNKYLLCASPERYLKKTGNTIISQPIKGTAKRGATPEEDAAIRNQLLHDEKERAENIMIVDLVRNDLSRTAQKASVHVEELCGIYSFRQVHQMISTVVSELSNRFHFTDAIRFSFPMGSMTGAPKISAMQLIEKFEKTKRGLYSGSVGYITPDGNFDFNVVIRSILFNETLHYLSFSVGGAITCKSIPEKEYEECLLKAEAIMKVLDFPTD